MKELLKSAYRDMGPVTGLFPSWPCLRCGKTLGAKGGGPDAENYAGTYNGLCYACTAGEPYVESTDPLDGALSLSWRPSRPSWRRDREREIAYADCAVCGGLGRPTAMPYRYVGNYGERVGASCASCRTRRDSHPTRVWAGERDTRIRNAASNIYFAELRRRKLFRAAKAGKADAAVIEAIKAPIVVRYAHAVGRWDKLRAARMGHG